MKRKILTKHILMALAMAAMVPAGQAWAAVEISGSSEDQNYTVKLDGDDYSSYWQNGQTPTVKDSNGAIHKITDFDNVIINKNSTSERDFGLDLCTLQKTDGNVSHMNFNVTMSGRGNNSDALHLRNWENYFQVHDFIANVSTVNSDAINIGSESTSSTVEIHGDLNAIVNNGNGIRANSQLTKSNTDPTSKIIVHGETTIILNGGNVTNEKGIGGLQTVKGTYNPAAVYAGNDSYNCHIQVDSIFGPYEEDLGSPSFGHGVIELMGNTTINIGNDNYGLYAGKNGQISIGGDLRLTANGANSIGIAAENSNLIYKNHLEFSGLFIKQNINQELDTSANTYGTSVMLGEGKDVSISMQGDNSYAMYAEGVDDTTEYKANSITGKELNTLYAVGDMLVENGGLIDLGTTGEKTDNNGNSWGAYQLGAVIASGTNKVSDDNIKKSTYSLSSANANYISSESVIADAGDLNTSTDDQFKNKSVISALYAEDGADIKVSSGQSNTFLTKADPTDDKQLERVIWAYNGADITVDGTTTISTDRYKESPNSADIAIAAGTAVGISADTDFNTSVNRAEVNLNYGAGSSITGDILAGYAGEVNIDRQDAADDAGIRVVGNLLAGNNGILNVDLGNGGTLEGRADDYGDAGVVTMDGYTKNSFRHPAFSSGIYKGGAVNLTMGEGARWNVTGQSWITSIDTKTGKAATVEEVLAAENPFEAINNMATIDLVHSNTDYNATAHALTIYEMNGDAVFKMSLDGDRDVSDMLYMKTAEGNYIVNLQDAVEINDMYHDPTSNIEFDGLRFATVGAGSNVSFRVFAKDQGMQNIEYTVESKDYNYNSAYDAENDAYNSTNRDTAKNEQKPGSALVEDFFASEGEPPADSESNGQASTDTQIMLLDATARNSAGESTENGGAENSDLDATTNFRLVGIKNTTLSNAGQTVIDMSKVNYSNAVYMDRLNKRMGEARYIDGDDGLWVRLRHDRIGREDAFRSMNTMFELGYDRKVQDQKDGEHRRGVAFDYMRGEANYTNVMGSGDVRRAGVWLYDTWLGDKGHYSDYVVKYGRLSNDFDIFSESGDKISGDYDNDVWSASAEYGRKKDIGSEWYFEPQAQLQYAYVTSADYTTSQGTRVELDGIDSLIGRAGFRMGRDTSEGNTVYFKADILHEFLGDQGIHAMDTTTNGVLSTTYENEGTWYDVGFGFSHRMGEDSYMFLDVEHSFGNDNEDTYQINIGLNRAF